MTAASAVETRSINLSNNTIAYQEVGQGKDVVFLHGGGGRSPAGAAFVPALGEHYRVLLPSRPGYDESTLGSCETPQDAAEVMAEFIRATCAGPVNLIAQSAGATPALWLAVLHPELVETLVLSAPAAFGLRPPGSGPSPALLTPEELSERLYGKRPSWNSLPTAEDEERRRRNVEANGGRFRSPDGNAALRERLKEITARTLVLWGTNDAILDGDTSAIYQKEMQHVFRVFLHGAAHELPISATSQWVHVVSDFIELGDSFVINAGPIGLPQ